MNVFLFDIDGTLVASGGAGKAALELALTEVFAIELRRQVPYSGRTDRAILCELLECHGIACTAANVETLLEGYLQRLPDCLRRMKGRVLPGIPQLLGAMRLRRGALLGLLTGNVRAGANVKLGHYGLAEHFSLGGFGDRHLDRDDVAREALAAVQELRPTVQMEHVWVIGDTPLDVRCGRAIGARVLAVATGLHSMEELADAKPDLLLRDLSDPGAFLELWLD